MMNNISADAPDDKLLNFDTIINLGTEKNGVIGKKRVRNEVSLGDMEY